MFGVIGREAISVKKGLLLPNDVASNSNGIRTRDDGLVHHFPFTSDLNDLFGTLTLTNNNGVTFDGNGALLNRSAKKHISATVTWPDVFTWLWDFKYLDDYTAYGAPNLSIGCDSNIGAYGMTFELSKNGTTQTAQHAYAYAGNGNCYTTSANFIYADSNWHRAVVLGRRIGGGPCICAIDGLILVASAPYAVAISTSFAIGRCGAGDWGYGDAYVRDFKVYNRHLTPVEIAAA